MPRTVHDPVRTRSRQTNPGETFARETLTSLQVIAPNVWMCECNCLIGPFAHRHVAEAFANAMVEFGQYEGVCEHVILHADAFYVHVMALREEPRVVA